MDVKTRLRLLKVHGLVSKHPSFAKSISINVIVREQKQKEEIKNERNQKEER